MSEHASRSATARQNGLAELAQRALEAADLSPLLVEAAGLLADATGGWATVFETRPDGSLRVHATAGTGAAGDSVGADEEIAADAVDGTTVRQALTQGETVATDKPSADLFGAAAAGVYAPITDDEGNRWGLVTVHTSGAAALDDETTAFVENAADVLGSAFDRLRAESGATAGGRDGEPSTDVDIDTGADANTDRVSGWQRSEAGLDEVFGRVTDAFFALDDDWRFTYLNEQAEKFLERDADDLIGGVIWDEFPEAMGMTFEEKYQEAMETGEPVSFEEYFPPLETWFAVRAFPSETGLSVYFRDVTERREREQELVTRSEQQAAVAELGQQAIATSDLDALFQEATEIVADRLETDYCKVLDLLPSGNELFLRAGVGWQDGLVGSATVGTGEDSQAGYTLRSEEPVVVEDLDAESRFSGPDLLVDHDVVSGVSVIIGPTDDPWGVLGTHHTSRREFSEHDVDFVQSVATLLATAIEREAYERELEKYETIVETVADGVYIVDPGGEFRLVNEAYAEMTGYDREELVGTHSSAVTVDEARTQAGEMAEELASGERQAASLETELATKDGDHIPVEARFAPIPIGDNYGRVGVVRDITDRKQYEETLTALHTSSHELLEADTRDAVAEVAVETATDVLGLEATAVYLFDDDEHAIRPAAYTEYVAELFGDPPPAFSSGDESITWRTFLEGETTLRGDAREDEYVEDGLELPLRSGLWIPLGDHGVFATLSEDIDAFDEDMERLADLLATTTETALDRIEREETLRERERDLEERNDRLLELDRINSMIRDIDQALVGSSTREEVESAVCEHLTSQEGFDFAWVGQTDPATDEVVVREWAGTQRGYLDAVDRQRDGDEPACRTERSREATVVESVADELRTEPWRKRALARDFQSVVSVPIGSDELEYGTLTVYANESAQIAAFADVIEELGETIGNAIDAAEARRTMHTDTGVSLDLRVGDDDPFAMLARETGCAVSLEGLITQASDQSRVCVTTSGAPTDEVLAAAADLASIEEITLLSEKDDEDAALFEVVTAGPSIPTTVADLGATPKTVETSGDGTDVTVTLSSSASVREFIERLRTRYADTGLVARREAEQPDEPPQLFRAAVEDELTDRQQEVLQTAYLSGYFEWPREATGEELAEALGISQPTVNRHLRTAERKVYTRLFES